MESVIFLIATTFAYTATANKAKKPKAQITHQTYSYDPMFSKPYTYNRVKTKTGDIMYLGECNENEVTYGLINIELKERFTNLDDAEIVLGKFMKSLQPAFAIQHTTGLGPDDQLTVSKKFLTDYWQDVDQTDWKVKGWTDGATVSIKYVKNIGKSPVSKQERFLNDFRIVVS
jgi:hypothetical protein